MKPGINIDRAHPVPRLLVHRKGMVGCAPRRRRAVYEMRDPAPRHSCMRQQVIACLAACQIANPWPSEFGPGRGGDCVRDPVLPDIGEHGTHAFADQSLCDGAADPVARTRHQGRFATWVEGIAEDAHRSRRLDWTITRLRHQPDASGTSYFRFQKTYSLSQSAIQFTPA